MLYPMLTYLSLSCNTCGSLCLLTQLKVLYLNKIIKSVDVESFYPTSLEFLQCYSNSLPKKLLITQLQLHIENCNTHNVELPSCLDSLYLHYSEFEITSTSIFYTLILNESKINGEMIQKEFIKNFYCKRSKESEFINIELYLSLPQVKFCYCQK
ncbi:hypothetical protein CL6EHI_033880 [Entamoeba histolytica]|uniref:Uncharacterized protein n=2 Tax=Entamoeba histolytica TaxID=5759 RepID=B1N542_ENTH1|nr:hypothetical protein EHI_033880 [Entamoeba histolytica HM-1:IMSS]EDS88917.1 hypothetical protein EHI_033880 [Entamoeba histolytica HM-1:IMSS]GAT99185.1 hypothetical protein CL6EHI_033880 [Entamoeba histolytica]|eukprot:XP_001914308.1 hypothetical protein EHI_033880 [Entamoeba histolytica HM-1:IMSS]